METRERRTRYALTRIHHPQPPRGPCPSGRSSGQLQPATVLPAIVDVEGSALCEAIARLQVDRRQHDRDSVNAEDAFDAVLLRSREHRQSVRRRGSSKVACSMVSVCVCVCFECYVPIITVPHLNSRSVQNIDEDYWPPDDGLPAELDDHHFNGSSATATPQLNGGGSAETRSAAAAPSPSKRG